MCLMCRLCFWVRDVLERCYCCCGMLRICFWRCRCWWCRRRIWVRESRWKTTARRRLTCGIWWDKSGFMCLDWYIIVMWMWLCWCMILWIVICLIGWRVGWRSWDKSSGARFRWRCARIRVIWNGWERCCRVMGRCMWRVLGWCFLVWVWRWIRVWCRCLWVWLRCWTRSEVSRRRAAAARV